MRIDWYVDEVRDDVAGGVSAPDQDGGEGHHAGVETEVEGPDVVAPEMERPDLSNPASTVDAVVDQSDLLVTPHMEDSIGASSGLSGGGGELTLPTARNMEAEMAAVTPNKTNIEINYHNTTGQETTANSITSFWENIRFNFHPGRDITMNYN